jgi:MYXO-CTERM domain-containing protein
MHRTFTVSVVVTLAASAAHAAPLIRAAAGADAASIQLAVDAHRADLGINNGVGGGPFLSGRREINWDAPALDALAFPQNMPVNFFNRAAQPGSPGSPRGALFSTPDGEGFYVSARDPGGNLANPNLRFGDQNASYNSIFKTFSQQRLFAVDGGVITDVSFFVPGDTTTPATVSGFGAVFTDVDNDASTSIEYYDLSNNLIFSQSVGLANNGLSFLGVTFDGGERIARVRIRSGNAPLSADVNDGTFLDNFGTVDVVAMDDFFYGEPIAVPTTGAAALAGLVGLTGLRRRRN